MRSSHLLMCLCLLFQAACATPTQQAPSFLLLGEVHDNTEQHRQRAELLRELLTDGRPTAVVFEQIPRDRSAAIAAQRARAPQDAEALIDAAGFDREGWRWPLHRPLIEVALAAPNAWLLGGNLSREQLRPLMRGGEAAWPPDLLTLIRRTPWSELQQTAMLRAIDEGHCGLLPAAMQGPMVQAQRARDAAMAEVMLAARAAGAERVVLIAGNGHVDRELGVPRYLEGAGVAPSDIRAVGYLERGQEERGHFDQRVLTAPAEREDPCKTLKP